jgi:5-methylcytosine-specific restriction enzyme A
MPWAAKKPCAHVGCGVPVDRTDRYCDAHQKQSWRERTAARRSTPEGRKQSAFYSSRAWQRLRRLVLTKQPLCVECLSAGQYVPATVCDHIVAIQDGGAAWDESNLQGLCAHHHDAKSAREAAGRGARTG